MATWQGGLAVSRALGDFTRSTWTKCPGLLSEPDVTVFSVDADTEFILLASDGVFESMTNLDAVQSIRRQLRRNLVFLQSTCLIWLISSFPSLND